MKKKIVWLDYCLVGLGTHAETKLIPAIIKNNKNIISIVSKKKKINFDCNLFKNIDDALLSLTPNTVFVVASPPVNHYEIVKKIILSKRDVIVEKPAFVSLEEANEIDFLCQKNNCIFVELLMYKYTNLYKYFLQTWYKKIKKIKGISCTFLIPSLPANTFRSNIGYENSCLYDIGCYPISLLVDLNVDLQNLKITNYKSDNNNLQYIELEDKQNNIDLSIKIGFGFDYKNEVTIIHSNESEISFSPFFFGRKDKKIIKETNNDKEEISQFTDINGFQNLFNIPRDKWFLNQKERFKNLIEVNRVIQKIANDLAL